jgi:hypothetical protein
MFKYFIFDEDKQLIRKTRTLTEAKALCAIRQGWTYKFVKPVKRVFEDAPF